MSPSTEESPKESALDPTGWRAERGWLHWTVVLVVFSITGSLAVMLSRFVLHDLLGLQGSFWGGPWSYRIVYLLIIPPAYSTMLATIGTLAGKGPYFRRRVVKMWRRMLPNALANRLFGPLEPAP